MSERSIITVAPEGSLPVLADAVRRCAEQLALGDGEWLLVFATDATDDKRAAEMMAHVAAHLRAQLANPDADLTPVVVDDETPDDEAPNDDEAPDEETP
jgi:hypothetical protein